jgi:hypothetical protein
VIEPLKWLEEIKIARYKDDGIEQLGEDGYTCPNEITSALDNPVIRSGCRSQTLTTPVPVNRPYQNALGGKVGQVAQDAKGIQIHFSVLNLQSSRFQTVACDVIW